MFLLIFSVEDQNEIYKFEDLTNTENLCKRIQYAVLNYVSITKIWLSEILISSQNTGKRIIDEAVHDPQLIISWILPAIAARAVHIPVGARCQVESTEEDFHKRGTVRFVGPTKFGSGGGIWVGIEYDEPIGKNDGS